MLAGARLALRLALLLALLAACGTVGQEPFVYTDVTEIQPRPGLFSGPRGEFLLLQR